ncbi:DUF1178 family protein [Candidatus Pelagibacter sp. HIMB1623]|uniref:DUF1178 family protein n=1 Tax=Candidatus Pelagibacter sp. HIMB1623 TaxID=3413358 RepID=UPI003F8770D9
MIKYRLICKDCSIQFDSWFASSNEFEKLKRGKFLNCHNCNSQKVEKSLMSPQLINSKKKSEKRIDIKKLNEVKKTIKSYQKFIKDNFIYVGDNFAFEARTIHYNNKKKSKGIYGRASNKDIKELKDEGIDTQIIPWIEDQDN